MIGANGRPPIQSLSRALDLLEALGDEELGLVALGRKTGLQPSTAHRMLATLSARGYVQRRPSGRYALGTSITSLARSTQEREHRLRSASRPVMERVHRVSREAVHLTVLENSEIVFVDQLIAPSSPVRALKGEVRLPAHVSASGKAMLAFTPEHAGEPTLRSFTRRTITDPSVLVRQLDEVRAVGWAVDHSEYREEISCVAAPIFDEHDQVAGALSVSGSAERVRSSVYSDLGELIDCAATEISGTLGVMASTPPFEAGYSA